MKVPHHHNREQVSMADPSNMIRGHHPASALDKNRRMQSPGSKRSLLGANRTFGVPLIDLVKRAPHGYKVPYIVKKICTYIEHNGLDCEGIFRVNGSQRVVEKLKASFDQHGDANLDEDNDVMAVAGVLKMFLRELPESCVPEQLTKSFVNIQEDHQRNSKELVSLLKTKLRELPEEHYDLLKHVVRFLVIVSCNESINKMSPMALAIVFGPNLFRCGKGFLALKDQGSTNQIVYRFIVEYNGLFKDPTEDSPAVYWERKKHNIVPPRPPPPKFAQEEPEVSVRPTPLPRKSKHGHQIPEIEEPDHSESSVSSKGRYSHSYSSPNFSDEEMAGRISPFHLDSDSGFSLVESPVPSARTSEFVDKAIKATVIGHLFGDESSLLNASIDTTIREDHPEPEMQDIQSSGQTDLSQEPVTTGPMVQEVKKVFESSSSEPEEPLAKPSKLKPKLKAFEMFENKGIIITQLPSLGKGGGEGNQVEEEGNHNNQGEFERVKRTSDPLQSFKRPAGPQNRRSPSRRLTPPGVSDQQEETMDQQEDIELMTKDVPVQNGDVPKSKERKVDNDSVHDTKSRIAFLDIRHDEPSNKSPDKSPSGGAKPFVPPLDFSTLHENIGSNAPIPATKAQTGVFHRGGIMLTASEHDQDHESSNENNAPSPHADKTKRKAGTSEDDEDLPPFSQADQDQYKLHSHGSTDDELTAKMKSHMRKIQGLKKKIRQFEEAFESQNGYKPSHSEKAARPEVKKYMMELSRTRKEAKKLKEEAEMGSRSRHGSGTSSTGERGDPPDLPRPTGPTMSQTLDVIIKKLREKRKEAHRPEDIELMSHEQVQDEKLAVQKALLHFEGIHGRPKSREEKDLMRPVYDRYRMIKRLLNRQPMSPRGNLLPVPEDKPMDIQSKYDEHNMFVESFKSAAPVRVPTAIMENDDDEDHLAPLGTMEFAVTRDLSILKSKPVAVDDQGPHSPKARRKLEMRENIENRNTADSNLHELGVPELRDELIRSRNLKKKLRKALRDFEEGFLERVGRKVTREDRLPMQAEYNEYKQIKARLKLLEALLSKHNQHEDF